MDKGSLLLTKRSVGALTIQSRSCVARGMHRTSSAMKSTRLLVSLVSCAFTVLSACAETQLPVLSQPVGLTRADETVPVSTLPRKARAPDGEAPGVAEGRPLRGAAKAKPLYHVCGLPNTPDTGLHFAVDSDALRLPSEQVLDQVAHCLLQGTLRGDRLIVFGYTDPRGSAEYNLKLAMDRARVVRRYLIRRGVSPCRISVAARGKRYARGTGPEGWQRDRRVEVDIDEEPMASTC
jgi:outer membrane protein OmpA-like peptidoglycan-associated protein